MAVEMKEIIAEAAWTLLFEKKVKKLTVKWPALSDSSGSQCQTLCGAGYSDQLWNGDGTADRGSRL